MARWSKAVLVVMGLVISERETTGAVQALMRARAVVAQGVVIREMREVFVRMALAGILKDPFPCGNLRYSRGHARKASAAMSWRISCIRASRVV
jgi:hypothetical protein